MKNLKIAVAQVPSVKGDVDANIVTHLNAIETASELDVAYIVFPELSLTGYEPDLAAKLAFTENDQRLQPLVESAIKNKITIGVGVPLRPNKLPTIGHIVIFQTGNVESYSKIHLHPSEERYFSEGNQHHVISIGGLNIANAICADTNHAEHAKSCAAMGADVYIASVLITEGGYEGDTTKMQNYAREFNMIVAMANHNGCTGGWMPIGKSAIWSEDGLLASADETQSVLVVAEKLNSGWAGQLVNIKKCTGA